MQRIPYGSRINKQDPKNVQYILPIACGNQGDRFLYETLTHL